MTHETSLSLAEWQREMLTGPAARMDAYYYAFQPTGEDGVDAVLSTVAWAGKGRHDTGDWGEGSETRYGPFDARQSYVEVIQAAANDAAREVVALQAEVEQLRRELRHRDREIAELSASLR